MVGRKLLWRVSKGKDWVNYRNPYWTHDVFVSKEGDKWEVEAPGHDTSFKTRAEAIRDAKKQTRQIDKEESKDGFSRKR